MPRDTKWLNSCLHVFNWRSISSCFRLAFGGEGAEESQGHKALGIHRPWTHKAKHPKKLAETKVSKALGLPSDLTNTSGRSASIPMPQARPTKFPKMTVMNVSSWWRSLLVSHNTLSLRIAQIVTQGSCDAAAALCNQISKISVARVAL